ncbi:unannotated protein [freshwater metagenome]|uniref:Unannotated protein n=1 Tax=freshwater metagenome TaxID=449393 RepID=A0A6J7IX89_9ZZZZ
MTRMASARAQIRRSASSDRGSAVTEFLVIGVLILMPLAYIVMSVMRVQAAAFASSQAAREAGRAFVSADSVPLGHQRADVAARLAFLDQGFELPGSALSVTCGGGDCLAPGAVVSIDLNWAVDLPWIPSSLAGGRALSVPIHAMHEVPVDVFRVSS